MNRFAAEYPNRRPGSDGDDALATETARDLRNYNFKVSTDVFKAKTVDGTRTLENVVGVRAGMGNGSIVLVAHRDSVYSPARPDLSGTAVLLELARVMSGESLNHTVVLASTSGSAGAVGAERLAHTLPQPVDAVIALGDLAGTSVHGPVVVPWSDGQQVAPPVLRKTLASALAAQTALSAGSTGLGGQLAHLAVPISATEQAPFGGAGEPAVLLSVSGERTPPANEPASLNQITALGRTVLQTVTALDAGPTIPGPSSYLVFSGKSIPAWALQLLVLMLIVPVLVALATIDGVARARRRGHSGPPVGGLGAGGGGPVRTGRGGDRDRAGGWVHRRSTGPARERRGDAARRPDRRDGRDGVAGRGRADLAPEAGDLAGRPRAPAGARGPRRQRRGGGRGRDAADVPGDAGDLADQPVCSAAADSGAPPALWIVVPDVRLPIPVTVVMLLAAVVAPALVAASYATTLGLGPFEAVWSWVLLLAGGGVSVVAALEWSVVLGCTFSVIAIAVQTAREPRHEDAPVTIRGPVTYAVRLERLRSYARSAGHEIIDADHWQEPLQRVNECRLR